MADEIDYGKLGVKMGLEIHQQLDTRKLFCNCPSLLRRDEPDFIVKRKLHAVAGEEGGVDVAALYQASLKTEFIYQGYDSTCLVELDEEPPHQINREALKIALHIAFLLNMKIIPITQIMRKTVIDGSNTSGFQRTVLIARDGFVKTSFGRVGIDYLYLEEDAARIIERGKEQEVYRLDRLGIPLVEIVTSPDLKNPEQAKETALTIGNILRSCKVKRGIGTIRQDINISIREENRVEIKGMQNMKIFLKAIDNEILRQKKLSDSGKPTEMEVRNVLASGESEFMRPLPGVARMYPETDLSLLRIHRGFINEAKKDLPKIRGGVEEELKGRGLNEDMIKLLFKQDMVEEFKEMLKIINNAPLVAKALLIFPKEISAKENINLDKVYGAIIDEIPNVLRFVDSGKISENQIKDVFLSLVKGKSLKEAAKFEKADVRDVEEKIAKLIREKPGLSVNAYVGLVMKEFEGKVSGREAMEIIKKYM